MLAIRLQRLGRKGYPTYRLIVQESQRHPSSGRVVAYVGSYNPHTKESKIEIDEAQKYLDNGAQPTPRVSRLLEAAGVKLPSWASKLDETHKKSIKNPDKLRKNQPKEDASAEAPAENGEETSESGTDNN